MIKTLSCLLILTLVFTPISSLEIEILQNSETTTGVSTDGVYKIPITNPSVYDFAIGTQCTDCNFKYHLPEFSVKSSSHEENPQVTIQVGFAWDHRLNLLVKKPSDTQFYAEQYPIDDPSLLTKDLESPVQDFEKCTTYKYTLNPPQYYCYSDTTFMTAVVSNFGDVTVVTYKFGIDSTITDVALHDKTLFLADGTNSIKAYKLDDVSQERGQEKTLTATNFGLPETDVFTTFALDYLSGHIHVYDNHLANTKTVGLDFTDFDNLKILSAETFSGRKIQNMFFNAGQVFVLEEGNGQVYWSQYNREDPGNIHSNYAIRHSWKIESPVLKISRNQDRVSIETETHFIVALLNIPHNLYHENFVFNVIKKDSFGEGLHYSVVSNEKLYLVSAQSDKVQSFELNVKEAQKNIVVAKTTEGSAEFNVYLFKSSCNQTLEAISLHNLCLEKTTYKIEFTAYAGSALENQHLNHPSSMSQLTASFNMSDIDSIAKIIDASTGQLIQEGKNYEPETSSSSSSASSSSAASSSSSTSQSNNTSNATSTSSSSGSVANSSSASSSSQNTTSSSALSSSSSGQNTTSSSSSSSQANTTTSSSSQQSSSVTNTTDPSSTSSTHSSSSSQQQSSNSSSLRPNYSSYSHHRVDHYQSDQDKEANHFTDPLFIIMIAIVLVLLVFCIYRCFAKDEDDDFDRLSAGGSDDDEAIEMKEKKKSSGRPYSRVSHVEDEDDFVDEDDTLEP